VAEPLIGPRQPFPQRCMECGERFVHSARVTALPALEDRGGQVLWYVWLDEPCARASTWLPWQARARGLRAVAQPERWTPPPPPPPPEDGSEPPDARRARLAAERALDRRALAIGRARQQYGARR
jgi:hypothetical protein